MASNRNQFVRRLHLIGLLAASIIAAATAGILAVVSPPTGDQNLLLTPVVWGSSLILLLSLVIAQVLVRLLLERVLKQTGKAAGAAMRVSEGDLSLPAWSNRT